ncbi:MAG TPA: hypothetical protein VIO64_06140 [Pseudobacteroides sp.]|uniref:FIMAH domain-containing protein n=1 Tax=Pseudobacteroides sp. TaxID=1968840 RepID=UPI002F9599A9
MKGIRRFSRLGCFIFVLIFLVSASVCNVFASDIGRSAEASYVVDKVGDTYTYTVTVKNTSLNPNDSIYAFMLGNWYDEPIVSLPLESPTATEFPEGWSSSILGGSSYNGYSISFSSDWEGSAEASNYIRSGNTAIFKFTAYNELNELKIGVCFYNDSGIWGGEGFNGYAYKKSSSDPKLITVDFEDDPSVGEKFNWNPDFGVEPADIASHKAWLLSKGIDITGTPAGFVFSTRIYGPVGNTGVVIGNASPHFEEESTGLSEDETLSIKFLKQTVSYAKLSLTSSPSDYEKINNVPAEVIIEAYDSNGELVSTSTKTFTGVTNGKYTPDFIEISAATPCINTVVLKVNGHPYGGIYIEDITFGSTLNQSPDLLIKDLIDSVKKLGTSHFNTNYLTVKLYNAKYFIEEGKTDKAYSELKSFIKKVESTSKRHLFDETKTELISKAQSIIDVLK